MLKIFFTHLALAIVAGLIIYQQLETQLYGITAFLLCLGLLLLMWLSSLLYSRRYFKAFYHSSVLFLFFTKELMAANLRISYYVVTRGLQFQSAILKLPLDLKSDWEIALLANLITLTPGTLTLEISPDKKFLYFHMVDVPEGDTDTAKQRIKAGFEKLINNISQ